MSRKGAKARETQSYFNYGENRHFLVHYISYSIIIANRVKSHYEGNLSRQQEEPTHGRIAVRGIMCDRLW